MRDSSRVFATLIIWVALASLLGGLLTTPTGAITNADGVEVFGIVLVLTIAGVFSTGMVWFAGRGDQHVSSSSAKAKNRRSNRAERLIQSLDDDEIYDLEALLLARDNQSNQQAKTNG